MIWFFCLYVFSGYGIFSSLMLLWDGPSIVRDTADMALEATAKLRATAETGIRLPEYEDMAARVRTQRANLYQEIVNGGGSQSCGVWVMPPGVPSTPSARAAYHRHG